MKTKVIIEQNRIKIYLKPENSFERDIVEKHIDVNKYNIETEIWYEQKGMNYGNTNHQIMIELTPKENSKI